ncbi:MAG: M20 family metallopeptidase [Proteobacteria bacterium]|nr:M20 family metallopeptidase [Pseudomonadota bacterium]
MDELKRRIRARIESFQDEAIAFLADLVRAESVNPPGDTRRVMDAVLDMARTFTDQVRVVAAEPEAPNVFITLHPGGRPQLLYNGHLDTVPPGDVSQWRVEPFGAVIRDNRMYGRGVADMKGGCAAMLMAAKALQLENAPLRGSLVVNFVSDEETGGARGAGYLMEQGHYDPDMVVVGEITNRNRIAIAEKGVIVYALSTRGRTAHASTPWVGLNAIDKMVKLLHGLQTRLPERLKEKPSGSLPPATFNVGTIQGGVGFNVVPDACQVLIDRRILPGETIESATAEIREIIDQARAEDPDIDASLDVLGSGPPFETAPDEALCLLARRTMEEMGRPGDFVGYEQVSDGRFFAERGIPTILIGPGLARTAHTPNEHLELDQYIEAIQAYALLALNALV